MVVYLGVWLLQLILWCDHEVSVVVDYLGFQTIGEIPQVVYPRQHLINPAGYFHCQLNYSVQPNTPILHLEPF